MPLSHVWLTARRTSATLAAMQLPPTERCALHGLPCRNGLSAWLRMALLCLLCLLGFWGNHTTLQRAAIQQHASRRAEARRRRLLQQTQAALLKMRTNAASGRQALDGGGCGGRRSRGGGAASAAGEPPDPPDERWQPGGSGCGARGLPGLGDSYMCSGAGAAGTAGEQSPEDYAYACYSQAAQLLKVRGVRLRLIKPLLAPCGWQCMRAAAERSGVWMPRAEHRSGPPSGLPRPRVPFRCLAHALCAVAPAPFGRSWTSGQAAFLPGLSRRRLPARSPPAGPPPAC